MTSKTHPTQVFRKTVFFAEKHRAIQQSPTEFPKRQTGLNPRSFVFWAVLGITSLAVAQESAPRRTSENEPSRRSRRPAPVISPEIAPNQQVTFRLRAPNAGQVRVNGQWSNGNLAMTKGDNGIWSVTTGPIDPGVWEYRFQVDGVSMIDPGSPAIKPMRQPRTSILHLPGNPPLIHDFQEVPHGVVHSHTYSSKSLDRLRELMVYTPPGYDRQTDRVYPALYLQHGSGDNHATWTVHGKAHWILDNLIAQGKAKPMVVVMMDGHASLERQNNTSLFERDLMEDVMPFVDENYRVSHRAEDRGIVGLSMGGGQSLTIGLNQADHFSWVGAFSAGTPREEAVAATLDNPEAVNQKLKLLWIACGKDDFLLQRNVDFIARLNELKLNHEWHLTEGNHSWPVWREYLADFMPKLFQ